jgi:hypothetical protein
MHAHQALAGELVYLDVICTATSLAAGPIMQQCIETTLVLPNLSHLQQRQVLAVLIRHCAKGSSKLASLHIHASIGTAHLRKPLHTVESAAITQSRKTH